MLYGLGHSVVSDTLRVIGAAQAGAAVAPWYLPTGIAASDCVGAWQPYKAASQVASYLNLNSPGTADAAPATETWSADGWAISANVDGPTAAVGAIPTDGSWSCLCWADNILKGSDAFPMLFGKKHPLNNWGFFGFLIPGFEDPFNFAAFDNGNGTTNYAYPFGPNNKVLAVSGTQAYSNGAPLSTLLLSSETPESVSGVCFGGQPGRRFGGLTFKAAAIWNKPLTDGQILEAYTNLIAL